MKLICFTGIDGTGKTTLARATAAALNQRGVPATYLYGRTYPLLSRLLMALARISILRRVNPRRDYPGYVAAKQTQSKHGALRSIYTFSVLADYHVQLFIKLLPHLGRPKVLVADRYVYDTVISDLAVHLRYSQDDVCDSIRRFFRYFPKPMIAFLIDVPEETAFSRKNDVPHVDYLRERRPYYQALIGQPEVRIVDGKRPREALLQSVLDSLELSEVTPERAG